MNASQDSGNTDTRLKMKFAGRFIDLLGQDMYGGPVPAVAELIANAWDADATKVEISVPADPTSPGAEIIVKDYGIGMTFNEINNYYLQIGYERRRRGEKTANGRLVMGRKGIGKLAGFGIAEDIVVKAVKDGRVVQFTLNYNDLRGRDDLQEFYIEPEIDNTTDESSGVTITYRRLKLHNRINMQSFMTSMARRFAIRSDVMEVIINGVPLSKENLDFEHRIPADDGWEELNIPDVGHISYWFGFLKVPINDSELKGISIFAHGRIAQTTPFLFNLSGGINGQVGLEYLTGQVKAEFLDSEKDYIATDRQTVNWQYDKAKDFEKWGQAMIKQLCSDWKKRRTSSQLANFRHTFSQYNERIDRLAKQEREDLLLALDKVAEIERINEGDFKIIASSMISGVERESVKKVIKKINATDENSLASLIEAVHEWDVIAAVSTAEVIAGKIEIINQFDKYIKARLPEKAGKGKPDMQTFLKDHPWLLGHEYEHLVPADFHHEHGVDKWIEDVLIQTDKEYKRDDDRDGRRFDLLCIRDDTRIIVLELMAPGLTADYDHLMRLNRYVTRIQAAISDQGTTNEFRNKSVYGQLIADNLAKDSSLNSTLTQLRSSLDAVTWGGLFRNVKTRYKEFFDFLKQRAPEHPIIKDVEIRLDDESPLVPAYVGPIAVADSSVVMPISDAADTVVVVAPTATADGNTASADTPPAIS
ncbi:ATP-binding protein [Spirosoma fluviale]|uniref:Histidine kinase-, DNA gyrase B-, and HSP90-like ATPase n=1 Tax=Spirosoma fluviale TaxID=1597977 RepID=A0A286F604_9BACT|nr:ATP-binding protein [Spirosoma fluviale]SOD78324.1 Histidine kinase-, DNA gyrase B-, and HSP90-like ATPase [Spirosoma fluviale]